MPRSYAYVPIEDIFDDFRRNAINMAWLYSNMSKICFDNNFSIYMRSGKIFETTDIISFKKALSVEDEYDKKYFISLLDAATYAQKRTDARSITDFLLGNNHKLGDILNHNLIYDFKYLTANSVLPYVMPNELIRELKYENWKNLQYSKKLTDTCAEMFAEYNQLLRLHKSTQVCVDLCKFELDASQLADFINVINEQHANSIQKSRSALGQTSPKSGDGGQKNKGGAPAKPWWNEFWVEIAGRLYDGAIAPRSQKDVCEAMKQLAAEKGWDHGDSMMDIPARLLWKRIETQSVDIHGFILHDN